jgi:hypothetical protein
VGYVNAMDIIDFLIIRINRGCNTEQAIEEVSKMKYPIGIEVGMNMTKSPYPLELSQLREYYDVSFSNYFILLLECLRVMKSWEPYEACDALIVLKNWIGYNEKRKDYTPVTVFGIFEKNKPGTLERRAKEILFDKLQGVADGQYFMN